MKNRLHLISNQFMARVNQETIRNDDDDFVQDDDVSMAREMNTLSVEQREKIYEEIHGVGRTIDETPELISSSLEQMRKDLAQIPKRRRAVLDRALFLRPAIASDDAFHLMFLRACRFDPEHAAAKMHRYFKNKLELFGEGKLAKKITLDDLGDEEIRLIRQGSTQFIQVSQRRVIAQYTMFAALNDISDWKAHMRYLWYQLMVLLEDERVQRTGIVEVSNLRGPWKVGMHDMLLHLIKCNDILNDRPVRICAFHRLVEGGSLRYFVRATNKLMPKELRIRQRYHAGSDLEVHYALMAFGIELSWGCKLEHGVIAKMPVEDRYFQSRRLAEEEFDRHETDSMLPNHAAYPKREDVLMGRGRPYQTWPGNVHLAGLVMENTDQYIVAAEGGFDKMTIASYLVELIKRRNDGRFLVRTNVDWKEVDDLSARNKVSQLLRAEARSRRQGIPPPVISAYNAHEESPISDTKRKRT